MAKDPINHDGFSTTATIGSNVVKYGLLGVAAAAVGGFALAVLGAGILTAVTGYGFVQGAGTMLGGGALTWIVGGGAAITSGIFAGGWGAVGGGFLGLFKGAEQVSRENNAFRKRVVERMQGGENKEAKLFNDGEIKGIDEGYAMAVKDMEPQMQVAFQKGQESVVQQIQEQMMKAAAEAEQSQQSAPALAAAAPQPAKGNLADKFPKAEHKAEAIIQERQEQAAQPHQPGV